jgi:hypothetical protein
MIVAVNIIELRLEPVLHSGLRFLLLILPALIYSPNKSVYSLSVSGFSVDPSSNSVKESGFSVSVVDVFTV